MDGTIIKQTRMRAALARRMVESKQHAPHFYVQTEVIVGPIRERLSELKARHPSARVTMTVALVRACVAALRANPRFNSVWTANGLLQVRPVNLGIAIALEDGLLAPALLEADTLGFNATRLALEDLTERTRLHRLRPREIDQATFTLSNLGMFDVSAFTAIVTPPQVAILATARPVDRVVLTNGTPTPASIMTATLSADHRAVDGVDAAKFLASFKQSLENYESIFSDLASTAGLVS